MEKILLMNYDEWVAEHMDDLVEKYAGQVVAIHEGKIVLVGESERDLYRDILARGIEPMPLVFRVPREEDLQAVLRL